MSWARPEPRPTGVGFAACRSCHVCSIINPSMLGIGVAGYVGVVVVVLYPSRSASTNFDLAPPRGAPASQPAYGVCAPARLLAMPSAGKMRRGSACTGFKPVRDRRAKIGRRCRRAVALVSGLPPFPIQPPRLGVSVAEKWLGSTESRPTNAGGLRPLGVSKVAASSVVASDFGPKQKGRLVGRPA